MNIHALAFGKTYSRDDLLRWIYDTALTISPDVNGLKLVKARAERRRKAEQIIDQWIHEGELTHVDGGFSRGQAEPMVHFLWDNEVHSCKRSEELSYVRSLREIRALRSPEEIRRRETERRLAEAEELIALLRKDLP